ncbi:MAG: hypothetical protein JNL61_17795 [Rhizobiaceae bacterium]|nr:hypothetical protein [Rhizobiaceae bacterium]
MKLTVLGMTAALAGMLCGAAMASAHADEVSVELRNSLSVPLEAELYSQARPQNWPGGGALYRLEPGTAQSLQLSCTEGESICYGAWSPGNDGAKFGVGRDGVEKCETCCFTCESGAHAAFEIR